MGGISVPVYAYFPTREFKEKERVFEEAKDYERMLRGIKKAVQPLKLKTN
jgi:hypothetical protein